MAPERRPTVGAPVVVGAATGATVVGTAAGATVVVVAPAGAVVVAVSAPAVAGVAAMSPISGSTVAARARFRPRLHHEARIGPVVGRMAFPPCGDVVR